MTDKEKLEGLLPYCGKTLEDVVAEFLRRYENEFQPSRLLKFIELLEIFLKVKINCYELAIRNSFERASYIKSYLEGKMWKDEETAKANVDSQIKNAESIINFWHLATGEGSENGT